MPLMSFSEPDHIAKLLDGRKQQTTRLPRKNHIKVGDVLYCYYKAQAKNNCNNCLHNAIGDCPKVNERAFEMAGERCNLHNNKFGIAQVVAVAPIKTLFNEYVSIIALTEWAQADGFVNWSAADEWFTEKHGKNWKELPFEIIFFRSCWLEDNCSECGHNIDDDCILDSQPIDDYRSEPIATGYRCSNCGHEEWL